MAQIKRVPFDYEYFKKHPETKLETREGEEARFIGETFIRNDESAKLAFETKISIYRTSIDGLFVVGNEDEDDIFMLIEAKEVIAYVNVYDDYSTSIYDTLDEAIESQVKGAKSVAKLIIVDGEIDFNKCETVHKY